MGHFFDDFDDEPRTARDRKAAAARQLDRLTFSKPPTQSPAESAEPPTRPHVDHDYYFRLDQPINARYSRLCGIPLPLPKGVTAGDDARGVGGDD